MTSNTWNAPCARCGENVAPGEGVVNGKTRDGRWRVVHKKCIPVMKERVK